MRLFPTGDPKGVGGALVNTENFYRPSSEDGTLIYLIANPDVQAALDKVSRQG